MFLARVQHKQLLALEGGYQPLYSTVVFHKYSSISSPDHCSLSSHFIDSPQKRTGVKYTKVNQVPKKVKSQKAPLEVEGEHASKLGDYGVGHMKQPGRLKRYVCKGDAPEPFIRQ